MSKVRMSHLSVGQGDCTVIMYFDDEDNPIRSILLDCGENNAWSSAHTILTDNGFTHLDVALITHYDSDHFKGFVKLLRNANKFELYSNFLVGTQFWDRGIPFGAFEKNDYEEYVNLLSVLRIFQVENGIKPIERRTHNMNGGAKLERIADEDFDARMDEIREELEPFSEHIDTGRERFYYVDRVNHGEVFDNGGLFPWVEIRTKKGRFNRMDALFQRKEWPIRIDVANYGFEDEIDLKIEIIFANGAGVFNKATKDPLIDEVIDKDTDSQEMTVWRNLLIANMGDRITGVEPTTDGNQLGLGFLITFHNFRYWAGGDLQSAQEDALTDKIGKLSVLKAGHHGSSHSTSYRFLAETKPNRIVISTANTWNNGVQLPSPETMQRIHNAPFVEEIYMTGQPIPKSLGLNFLPDITDNYNAHLRFRVCANRNIGNDTIDLLIDSEQALEENPDFTISYIQQRVPKPTQTYQIEGSTFNFTIQFSHNNEELVRPRKKRRLQ